MHQHSPALDLAEALSHITAKISSVGHVESVDLAQAQNRVLAKKVSAPIDLPPFPASAMDGYAVHKSWDSEPEATLKVIGASLAGHPFDGNIGMGEAVRVFTGAAVPTGTHRVLLQEQTDLATEDQVSFVPHNPAETFVRPVGHDLRAGELLLPAATILSPFHLGMLASNGIHQVEVTTKPKVGVFSTGDELVDPGVPPHELKPGQIYDSNRFTVLQLLANLPLDLVNLGRLPDQEDAVFDAINNASQTCDALITSGGVSVGDADFVTKVLNSMGELEFWKLNLKPGKPMAYATLPKNLHNKCHVFGLPGNPVSTIVTLLMVARPALMALAGAVPVAPQRYAAYLQSNLSHQVGRAEFQRGHVSTDKAGLFTVSHTGDQSSNRLSSFAVANCLIEIDKDSGDIPAGNQVNIIPFYGLVG